MASYREAVEAPVVVAPASTTGLEEDDLDLLSMMASLEKASGGPTATAAADRRDGGATTAGGGTSATQMLATLATAMSTTAASRSMRATRQRISSTAATVMTSSLARHPALMLHLSRSEQTQEWKDAVSASLAYAMDEDEDVVDDNDVRLEGQEAQQRTATSTTTSTVAAGGSGGAVADQTVLSISGSEGIRNAFMFAQHVSDELERERLLAVFQGATPIELQRAMEAQVQRAHGVDAAKGVAYPGDAGAIPQRMWLHCLFGPLMSTDVLNWMATEAVTTAADAASPAKGAASLGDDRQHLAELRLPLTSAALARAVERIARNPYDTKAWLFVLETCMDVPLAECRSVWLFATYLFPTAGALVLAYAKKELEHADGLMQGLADTSSNLAATPSLSSGGRPSNATSGQPQQFREGDDEEDAKKLYRARMRLLNLFYRHLPRCASWQLYDVFLTFLQAHVLTDNRAMDQIYRVALEQHVGQCVDSTPLWIRYLEWRANKITAIPEKLKFVRSIFHRILRTPLDGLAEVRERYDAFESAEVRGGRVRLEDELERSMTRAKSFAAERMLSMDRLLQQRIVPASERMGDPLDGRAASASWVYLPRPFIPRPEDVVSFRSRCHDVGTSEPGSGPYLQEDDCVEAQQVWLTMHRILLTELESNLSAAQSEEGHFRRVAFFLRLRTQYFPHESFCWLELSNVMVHGLPRQRVRSDFGPTGLVGSAAPAYLGPRCVTLAAEVLQEALCLIPQHIHMTVALAELIRMRMGKPRMGERLFKDAVAAHRCRVMFQLFPMLDALQTAVHKVCGTGGGTAVAQSQPQSAGTAHTKRALQQRYAQLHATLLSVLERVMVLAGNWMLYARSAYPRNAATQTRLVAQYLLHELEILSMVMSAVRRLSRLATALQCPTLFVPGAFLDAFNAFCSHWINVELHQLHAPDAALLVLQGWMEQLRGMVLSTRSQGWTVTDCGVDERFFARALDIGRSTAKRSEQLVAAAGAVTVDRASGDVGAGPPAASRRRVHEVLSTVERLVDVLPTITTNSSNDNTTTHNAMGTNDLAFQCTQHRRWVGSMCQQLDPLGTLVLRSFPKLSKWHPATTDAIESEPATAAVEAGSGGDGAESQAMFETLRARHCACWAHGTEGILTGCAETVRTLWGCVPTRMLGTEEFASSSRSARETEWHVADCGAEDLKSFFAPIMDGPVDVATAEVEDMDPVHPDTTQWEVLPPRPPHVRGHAGARRGRGGGGYPPSGRGGVAGASHKAHSNLAADPLDDDEGRDDEELPHGLVSGGDGTANDPGQQQLINIDGAMMSMSAAMEKRARQTLGRRVAVQVASHRGNVAAAEGLSFWLDMVDTDRKLHALAEAQQQVAQALNERAEPPRSSHRAEGQEGPRHHHRRPETPEDIVATCYARTRPSTLALAANRSDDTLALAERPAPPAALRGQCAVESLLSHILPPRYTFGPMFDDRHVSVEWLVERLRTTDTLIQATVGPV